MEIRLQKPKSRVVELKQQGGARDKRSLLHIIL